MTQSAFEPRAPRGASGLHVAIVMDGNGRWAEKRGVPRKAGHRAGAVAVQRTVTAAAERGIGTLSLYAFSSDNWRRPVPEVRHLMRLFRMHLRSEAERCEAEGIRVSVIGRRDRLGPGLLTAIESVEARTREGRRLHLQLAIDYSAQDTILEAARLHHAAVSAQSGGAPTSNPRPALSRELFGQLISRALHAPAPMPPVDLLIRAGGEARLSDFMLWECAYAELVFSPCLWPDFGETDLDSALEEFRRRERRFGGLVPAPGTDARRADPGVPRSSADPSPTTPFHSTRVLEARRNG
jgi:undecaprenyl diphosphate synthase